MENFPWKDHYRIANMDDDDQHRSDDRSISRLIEKRGKYDIGGWKQKICANTQDLPDAEVDDDNAFY